MTLSIAELFVRPMIAFCHHFLLFCSLEIPAIFRGPLISAKRILYSSCFRIVQHNSVGLQENWLSHRLLYFVLAFLVNSLLLRLLYISTNDCEVRSNLLCICFVAAICFSLPSQLQAYELFCVLNCFSLDADSYCCLSFIQPCFGFFALIISRTFCCMVSLICVVISCSLVHFQ